MEQEGLAHASEPLGPALRRPYAETHSKTSKQEVQWQRPATLWSRPKGEGSIKRSKINRQVVRLTERLLSPERMRARGWGALRREEVEQSRWLRRAEGGSWVYWGALAWKKCLEKLAKRFCLETNILVSYPPIPVSHPLSLFPCAYAFNLPCFFIAKNAFVEENHRLCRLIFKPFKKLTTGNKSAWLVCLLRWGRRPSCPVNLREKHTHINLNKWMAGTYCKGAASQRWLGASSLRSSDTPQISSGDIGQIKPASDTTRYSGAVTRSLWDCLRRPQVSRQCLHPVLSRGERIYI